MARECEARAWGDLARTEVKTGNYVAARGAQERRLSIAESLDDRAEMGRTLSDLSTVAKFEENWPEARRLAEQALTAYGEAGQNRDVAFMQLQLGYLEQQAGHPEAARAYYQSSISMSRALGSQRGVGQGLRYLGELSRRTGDMDKAREQLQTARLILDQEGDVDDVRDIDEELATLPI
jgi:tetratricopeptide (TPR) repeat protein